MPPISGMQAIAAATFDGNPVDVGRELDSGLGGGSWLGLVSSGTLYVHQLESTLSSNLAPVGAVAEIVARSTTTDNERNRRPS
jgi:hypothetical protein